MRLFFTAVKLRKHLFLPDIAYIQGTLIESYECCILEMQQKLHIMFSFLIPFKLYENIIMAINVRVAVLFFKQNSIKKKYYLSANQNPGKYLICLIFLNSFSPYM